jgi:hypothetical protein
MHVTTEELWEAVFSVDPCKCYIWRIKTQLSESESRVKSLEFTVSSYETDPSEVDRQSPLAEKPSLL